MPTEPATDAFDALIRQHQAGVWRYLRALGARPDEADDLTQDVFVGLHGRLDRVPPAGMAGAFLRTVARGRLVDLRRAEHREARELARRAAALDATWTEADDAHDGGPWLAALRDCVERLDGRARDVVDAFYHDGLSRHQLAERLGLEEGSVKSRLFRIRSTLRRCVEDRITREAR